MSAPSDNARFVQVAVAEHSSDGFKGGQVIALDDLGRIWSLRLGEDQWKRLPKHPEAK